jgi:NMDA receptor-regulated protein 1
MLRLLACAEAVIVSTNAVQMSSICYQQAWCQVPLPHYCACEYLHALSTLVSPCSYYIQACALPSSALQLTDADRALLVELYTELQQKYPHSAAAKRIPLAFLQGDAFHTALDAYLKVNYYSYC